MTIYLSQDACDTGKVKVREVREMLRAAPAWMPDPPELRGVPRDQRPASDPRPTFTERVAAHSRPVTEGRPPWVVAADDPTSVWAIPDDVIDAYAADVDGAHVDVDPEWEPDAWKQRKDMQ